MGQIGSGKVFKPVPKILASAYLLFFSLSPLLPFLSPLFFLPFHIERFEAGQLDVLISSDAMARGVDLDHVEHVICYDAPVFVKTYVICTCYDASNRT